MNSKDIKKFYKEFGKQKIEITLDESGVHPTGPQNLSASLMITYYLLDYFRRNPKGVLAKVMIGGIDTVLSGFDLKVGK